MRWLLALSLLVVTVASHATDLRAISYNSDGGAATVRLEFSSTPAVPETFMTAGPALVLDFNGVKLLAGRSIRVERGVLQTIKAGASAEKTRLVIGMKERANYSVIMSGTTMVVLFEPKEAPVRTAVAAAPREQPVITMPEPLEELLEGAKRSIETGDFSTAITKLNQILLNPSSTITQEAHELIGGVYEQLKQPEKAKAEYRAFIAMYPDITATARVRNRLLALEIATPEKAPVDRSTRVTRKGQSSDLSATVASYWYTGSAGDSGMRWSTDQSILLVNYSATGLWHSDQYTTKLVARHSDFRNLLSARSNRATTALLNGSFDDAGRGIGIKVGRQNATLGVMGRFDGAVASYAWDSDNRTSVTYGVPYMGNLVTKRSFMGVGHEIGVTPALSFSTYLNRQVADGVLERNALGLEARYFKGGLSTSGSVEYDTLYRAINTAMLQGTLTRGDYTFYALADRRLAPALIAERATMVGTESGKLPYPSVGAVFNQSGYTKEQLYRYLVATSPVATAYVVSTSRVFTPAWTGSANLQVSNYYMPMTQSVIPPSGDQIDLPTFAPHSVKSLGIQALGTDVLGKNTSLHLLGSTSHSAELSSYYVVVLTAWSWKNVRFDTTLRRDRTARPGSTIFTTFGAMRANWKITDRLALESQYSLTHTTSMEELAATLGSINTQTFYIGIRYEL